MTDANFISALRGEIASRSRAKGSVITLGNEYVSGKAIIVVVEELLASSVRLSDGGEAWSELVSSGHARPEPTSTDRERIERMCEMYRVAWNNKRREIEIFVRREQAADAALRITIAAAALDAWRAWYPPQTTQNFDARRIVQDMGRLAPDAGWEITEPVHVKGQKHQWPVDARLSRKRRGVAAVMVNAEDSAERAIQQAVGWSYDVKAAGLVMVLSERTAKTLVGTRELPEVVATVGKRGKETAALVMTAAERVAAAA